MAIPELARSSSVHQHTRTRFLHITTLQNIFVKIKDVSCILNNVTEHPRMLAGEGTVFSQPERRRQEFPTFTAGFPGLTQQLLLKLGTTHP